MSTTPLRLIAPGLLAQPWSEAEVLGGVTWLWLHSASHRNMPLHVLNALLLPAIRHRQFILALESQRPVFYLAWANFSPRDEALYIRQSPQLMPDSAWNSGDRMWVTDWVAPFGHTRQMKQLVLNQLLANRCMRALYHRGSQRGLRIKHFHGRAVMPEEARAWFDARPLA